MVGGRVQQVVDSILTGGGHSCRVEVLNELCFDRCWIGLVEPSTLPRDGDRIWWQGATAFLTRPIQRSGCEGECVFVDRKIGRCYPARPPCEDVKPLFSKTANHDPPAVSE